MFCSSKVEACRYIDAAIAYLNSVKKEVTTKNYSHYDIEHNESRNLTPINTDSGFVGFRQIGPDIFSFKIENTSNLGKEWQAPAANGVIFNSAAKLWVSPSKEDVQALDKNLQELKNKTPKASKKKGLKKFKLIKKGKI